MSPRLLFFLVAGLASGFQHPVRRVSLPRSRRQSRTTTVVSMGPIEAGATYVWRAVCGLSGSDLVFGGIFGALFVYKIRQRKPGVKQDDPNAPKLSGFSYQFVAQTPEDEAKLKTMYCDDCGFTIFVAKNRFRKHFRDGLRCLNCGAKAPTFYNLNDPDDILNKEGATIDDFDEEAYFEDDPEAIALREEAAALALENGEQYDDEQNRNVDAADEYDADDRRATTEEEQQQADAEWEEAQQYEDYPYDDVPPEPEAMEEPVVMEEEEARYVEESSEPEHLPAPEEPKAPSPQEPEAPSKASTEKSFKGKDVPSDLQIFRDLDIL